MYGDVGHGGLLLLPALILCLFERWIKKGKNSLGEVFAMMFRKSKKKKKKRNIIVNPFFEHHLFKGARYLLVLMSLGAIYTGFLYNECFALPMFAEQSHWVPSTTPSQVRQEKKVCSTCIFLSKNSF